MKTEEIKQALGETGKKMSTEDIEKLMTTFDYLSDYWLDQKEIEIFGCPVITLLEQ